MCLLVDIGNSRVKWRHFSGSVSKTSQALENQQWKQALECNNWTVVDGNKQPIHHIIYSCVGNDELVAVIEKFATEASISTQRIQTTAVWNDLVNSYSDPSQMGVDRWLAMIAAWNRCQSACLIIDCGTAITVDAIDNDGQHLGGHIVAGLALQKSTLLTQTAKINAEQLHNNNHFEFGRNTSDAVNFGCLRLVLDYLDNSWLRFLNNNVQAKLFITGGDGEKVSELLDYKNNFHQDLVLEGIRLSSNMSAEQ